MEEFMTTCQVKSSEDLENAENMPRFIYAGLIYFKKYTNVRRQGFGQRMAVCEHLKTRGNELFKQNDIEGAIKEYEQVHRIFGFYISSYL
jgi:hypothetical protein